MVAPSNDSKSTDACKLAGETSLFARAEKDVLRGVSCRLPLLPPAAMPRRAAAGARGRAEFGAGLARVGRLEYFAGAAGGRAVVERRLARGGAVGAIGQGLGAVHFVEMGFVDF